MANLKANLSPYCLEAALAADQGDDCFVLDVGRHKHRGIVPSLQHVTEQVNDYIRSAHESPVATTKVYVVGAWNKVVPVQGDANPQGDVIESDTVSEYPEEEWRQAVQLISALVMETRTIRELTWISELPFMPAVWETLPECLTKLVLDLGGPVCVHHDGDSPRVCFVSVADMKPLLLQTMLKELRLFSLQGSFQSLVWETVFRNKSEGGVFLLDLQMASPPLVRAQGWRKAKDVDGLTIDNDTAPRKEYKGIDGKGLLHYTHGTGEYLDDLCMRRARIASGRDEAKPLPLWCLKLDGFVVDYLPFKHELSQIVLLTCGDNCIDAGLKDPKSDHPHEGWRGPARTVSPCLVQWPKWTGSFDERDGQSSIVRDTSTTHARLSALYNDQARGHLPPLTKETLASKELEERLNATIPRVESPLSATPSPTFFQVSNSSFRSIVANRGSVVPTADPSSFHTDTPVLSALDGSTLADVDDVAAFMFDDGNNQSRERVDSVASNIAVLSINDNIAMPGRDNPELPNSPVAQPLVSGQVEQRMSIEAIDTSIVNSPVAKKAV